LEGRMSWEKPNKLNVLQKSLNLAGLCFYLIRTRKFGAICVDSGGNTKFVGLFNLWIRKYYGSFFFGGFEQLLHNRRSRNRAGFHAVAGARDS
jgi:hypothetical protein